MTKKNFKSPAEMFIDTEGITEREELEEETTIQEIKFYDAESPERPPEGYKKNPLYIETRSQRVQLLVEPSKHKKIKELAKEKGESMNELYNQAIDQFLRNN